jgi:hypothetical protein
MTADSGMPTALKMALLFGTLGLVNMDRLLQYRPSPIPLGIPEAPDALSGNAQPLSSGNVFRVRN